jgi:hypothetical protein
MTGYRQAFGTNGSDSGGIRESVIDARVASLLAGEARHRLTRRAFGVPRRDSALLGLIAVCAFADAVGGRAKRVRSASRPPSLPEALFVAAAAKEVAHRLAGPASREAEDFGPLVTLAIVGAIFRTVVGPLVRPVNATSRRVRTAVASAFGDLIGDPRTHAAVAPNTEPTPP